MADRRTTVPATHHQLSLRLSIGKKKSYKVEDLNRKTDRPRVSYLHTSKMPHVDTATLDFKALPKIEVL